MMFTLAHQAQPELQRTSLRLASTQLQTPTSSSPQIFGPEPRTSNPHLPSSLIGSNKTPRSQQLSAPSVVTDVVVVVAVSVEAVVVKVVAVVVKVVVVVVNVVVNALSVLAVKPQLKPNEQVSCINSLSDQLAQRSKIDCKDNLILVF
jgi:hypothetical protein